jgi:hypothetical protein
MTATTPAQVTAYVEHLFCRKLPDYSMSEEYTRGNVILPGMILYSNFMDEEST